MSTITLNIKEKVAYLTLNRAQKHNALTQSMWQSIAQACDSLADNPDIRAMVLTGAGNKAFCAGADIQELHTMVSEPQRFAANNQMVQLAQQKLAALPFATIAKINGVCVGGGMGLALCCDFRIAVTQAAFAITPSKLGLLYSVEDTQRLVNIVGQANAKEMLYLGRKIDAQKAVEWGLVTQVVENEMLDGVTQSYLDDILSVSGYSIAGAKKTLAHINNRQATDADRRAIRALFDDAFSGVDFKEGAAAFVEKRPARFS